MLTKQELQNISNLLFTGKWNLSAQENQQVVIPLINSIAKEIDEGKEGKEKTRVAKPKEKKKSSGKPPK